MCQLYSGTQITVQKTAPFLGIHFSEVPSPHTLTLLWMDTSRSTKVHQLWGTVNRTLAIMTIQFH